MEVLEQLANESPVHNVLAIGELNILITDLYSLSDETLKLWPCLLMTLIVGRTLNRIHKR